MRLVALWDNIIEGWVLIEADLASLGQVTGANYSLEALLQEHIYGVRAPLVLEVEDLGSILGRI